MADYLLGWFIRRVIIGITMMVIAVVMTVFSVGKHGTTGSSASRAEVSSGPNGLQDSWNTPSSSVASSSYNRGDGTSFEIRRGEDRSMVVTVHSPELERAAAREEMARIRPGRPMMDAEPSR